MTITALIILALGAWRTWRIISTDEVLDWPRDRILHTTYPAPGVTHYGRPKLATFLGCPWCCGFWVSLAFFAAWHWWSHTNTLLVAFPLALSAIVGLVTTHLDS